MTLPAAFPRTYSETKADEQQDKVSSNSGTDFIISIYGTATPNLSPTLRWNRSDHSNLTLRIAFHLSLPSFSVDETIWLRIIRGSIWTSSYLFFYQCMSISIAISSSKPHALAQSVTVINHLHCTMFKSFHSLPAYQRPICATAVPYLLCNAFYIHRDRIFTVFNPNLFK